MSLTSYRAAPSRDTFVGLLHGVVLEAFFWPTARCAVLGLFLVCYMLFCIRPLVFFVIVERYFSKNLIRFGDDLLSHVLRRSTIGATALNGQVRDGAGCFARAMITKPNKVFRVFQVSTLSVVYAFDLSSKVLLLLDQIKPIEPLVPVN